MAVTSPPPYSQYVFAVWGRAPPPMGLRKGKYIANKTQDAPRSTKDGRVFFGRPRVGGLSLSATAPKGRRYRRKSWTEPLWMVQGPGQGGQLPLLQELRDKIPHEAVLQRTLKKRRKDNSERQHPVLFLVRPEGVAGMRPL